MDNQHGIAPGGTEVSAGEKVKCVGLYTSLDSSISRGDVIAWMLMLHKSVVQVDLYISAKPLLSQLSDW